MCLFCTYAEEAYVLMGAVHVLQGFTFYFEYLTLPRMYGTPGIIDCRHSIRDGLWVFALVRVQNARMALVDSCCIVFAEGNRDGSVFPLNGH